MIVVLGRLVAIEFSKVIMLGLMLFIAYYFLSFQDTYKKFDLELNQLKNTLSQEELKARETKLTEERAQTVQQNVTRLSRNLDDIQKKLPNNITTSDVISYVDGFARVPLIQIDQKTPKSTIREDIIEILPVEIKFNANYFQLGGFFLEAAKFPTITTISQYKIRRMNSDPVRGNILNIELVLNGYRSIENKDEKGIGKSKQ